LVGSRCEGKSCIRLGKFVKVFLDFEQEKSYVQFSK
jgi:hypothetical protein